MPLPHPLVQLCGLLLAVAVTCASASAPVYGPGEVTVNVAQTPPSTTRASQKARCSSIGGVLLPTVTDAVFEMASQHVNAWGTTSAVGYMGGSTIQSSSDCTVYNPSLSCVWSWDEGRYAVAGEALPFYRGNRDPIDLPNAAMIGKVVSNHWYVSTIGSPKFPGFRMQRYGVLLRGYWGTLNWADSSDSEWSYKAKVAADPYTFCAIEQPTTTSTAEPKSKGNGLSAGAAAGIAIGTAAAVGLIVGLVLWLSLWNGRYWCAKPAATTTRTSSSLGVAEGPDVCEECAAASRRGSISRANSVRSYLGDFEESGNRSFHDGTPSKDGGYEYGSFRGGMFEGEGGVWQDADGITHVEGSQSMGAAPGPSAVSVPSRRGSMMMTTMPSRPQTMMTTPMPSETMMQPQPSMRDNWPTWETPQTEDVSASGPEDQQAQQRHTNESPTEH